MYFKVCISIIFTLYRTLYAWKHFYIAKTHKHLSHNVDHYHAGYVCRLSFETWKMNEDNIVTLSGNNVNAICHHVGHPQSCKTYNIHHF